MEADGLDIEKMENKAKEFTLAGDYRRIKVLPVSLPLCVSLPLWLPLWLRKLLWFVTWRVPHHDALMHDALVCAKRRPMRMSYPGK